METQFMSRRPAALRRGQDSCNSHWSIEHNDSGINKVESQSEQLAWPSFNATTPGAYSKAKRQQQEGPQAKMVGAQWK